MVDVSLALLGEPHGKGRPRFARRGRFVSVYQDAKTEAYEAALAIVGREAMRAREPLSGPLSLSVMAVFGIPASWSKKKQAAALAGDVRPTGKPDIDNIVKITDALNKIVWADDAQVVTVRASKWYGAIPRLRIEVSKIEGKDGSGGGKLPIVRGRSGGASGGQAAGEPRHE